MTPPSEALRGALEGRIEPNDGPRGLGQCG
jgi:hypothetical protein